MAGAYLATKSFELITLGSSAFARHHHLLLERGDACRVGDGERVRHGLTLKKPREKAVSES